MKVERVRLVQDAFGQMVPIRAQAATLFYGRLFDIAPETRALFTATDMESQGRKLMAALATVVSGLSRPETMLPVAQELARRHAGYGVRPAHYASVGAALLWTLRTSLGDAFTPEVEAAWTEAYGSLSQAMIAAAAADGADTRTA